MLYLKPPCTPDPNRGRYGQTCHCPEASAIPDGTRRSCRTFHGKRYRPVQDCTSLQGSAFRRPVPARKRNAPQRNHCRCRRSSHHRTPCLRVSSAAPSHDGASQAQSSESLRSVLCRTRHPDRVVSHRHPPSSGQQWYLSGSGSCPSGNTCLKRLRTVLSAAHG